MNERNLRVLEFSKIRERMSTLAITPMGREHALALMPSSDPYTVRMMQQRASGLYDVKAVLTEGSPVSLSGVRSKISVPTGRAENVMKGW